MRYGGRLAARDPTSTQNSRWWRSLDPLEAASAIAIVCVLLPGTWPSRHFGLIFWWALNNLGVSQQMGGWFFYAVGWLLCACLLMVYARQRSDLVARSPTLRRFADAGCLLTALCTLDIALSTDNPYTPENASWPFFTLAPVFVCVLYLSAVQSMRLVRIIAVCTGIQATYAVFYYITAQNQFHTPHFGNRTSGTFDSPNLLYPLCLIGIPLCVALCQAHKSRFYKVLFGLCTVANLLALLSTYTRAAWVGMAVAALIGLKLPGSPWRGNKGKSGVVMALAAIGIFGALFLRTGGHVAANSNDRSTRGRFQIWRVGERVIEQHPWLGNGISTYQQKQSESMTPALERYNPLNAEAKSLYLNTWAEMGLVGLGALILLGFRFAQLYGSMGKSKLEIEIESTTVVFATAVGFTAIAIAGLADTPILQYGRVPATFALMLLLGACAAIARDSARVDASITRTRVRPLRTSRILYVSVGVIGVFCLWTSLSTITLLHRAGPVMDHYVDELNRLPIYSDNRELSGNFADCLIPTEDNTFFAHHGVDWEAERRSISEDIRSLSFAHGGSTITMQAVRYIMLPYDKTPARKIAQIILALQLERRLTKQQILRLYCDSVSFGLHAAGLQNAARIYFNKQPEKLNLGECAFLVGAISHPPNSIEQVTPQFVQARILPVLAHMEPLCEGKYSAEEFENARQAKLHFAWER